MTPKLAVVTLVTSPEWKKLADLTMPSQRHYARRVGADFLVIDKRSHGHPHYDKWHLFDVLADYRRVVYFDADIIVRPDCPNLFVSVDEEQLGAANELVRHPWLKKSFDQFCRRLGVGPMPISFYVNAGMFVASARHRSLFRPPEAVFADLPWPEQSHFNVRLMAEKVPLCFLPHCFNDSYREGDYLRQSYILHYAGMPHDKRFQAVRDDLDGWNRLFRHDARPGAAIHEAAASLPAAAVPILRPANQDRDYIAPGFTEVRPDRFFPAMIIGDKAGCPWKYLRRDIPHHWYVDRRATKCGFLSRDEVHVLYNTALALRGQPALEIGCWLGWSACHLALAGVDLDVIDPVLEDGNFRGSIEGSLRAAGILERVNLVAGRSPQAVHDLVARRRRPWSLIFIDGNHDAPFPLQDAVASAQCAAEDAVILFHDLVSPDVAHGFDYLREHGWNTLVYQTMQMMGVAWRGRASPVAHVPDPGVRWLVPDHLRSYEISGSNARLGAGADASA